MDKRCTNCGRFPFCKYYEECKYSAGQNDYWIKRKIENKEEN